VTYLLDANALIALGVSTHVFHDRMEEWLISVRRHEDSIATCAITELAFVRIVPQLPGLGVDVAQAKELLRRLKKQTRLRVDLLPDSLGAERLPGWVKAVKQTTDGHLVELAKGHSAKLATLDGRVPGAFVIPG
jgi:predicted nucleic acid-binding protein